MRTPSKFPPPDEWDFRKIPDSAIPSATLYEYARSSDKLRPAIERALKTKERGKSYARHIYNALLAAQKSGSFTFTLDYYPDGLWRKIKAELAKAVAGNADLRYLIMDFRPDFPRHWMAYPIEFHHNPKFSRVLVTPLAWEMRHIADRAEESKDPQRLLELEANVFSDRHWKLGIEWHGATVAEIVDHFEKWVREEAKKHPEMKPRGRAGQVQKAPLAWLAAYRLHKAGVSFDDAYTRLEMEDNNRQLLPFYSEKSGWSDALKHARDLLTRLETGQNIVGF